MRLPMFQIDAFTRNRFSGNPAAVVLLETPLPDATLQAIAMENNLSETAFVLPKAGHFNLRWFTPMVEVDLCGHATLATAFVLFQEGKVPGDSVRFETFSGTLTVRREGNQLCMDFPSRPPEPVACADELIRALGRRPLEVHRARDLLVLFETEDDVAELRPDFEQVRALDEFGIIATAPGRSVDFVSRFFAPGQGIPEDPVTGSAHSTLAPFWEKRLGRSPLHAQQISARGGELLVEVSGDRVFIRGHAVEYLRGQIQV